MFIYYKIKKNYLIFLKIKNILILFFCVIYFFIIIKMINHLIFLVGLSTVLYEIIIKNEDVD